MCKLYYETVYNEFNYLLFTQSVNNLLKLFLPKYVLGALISKKTHGNPIQYFHLIALVPISIAGKYYGVLFTGKAGFLFAYQKMVMFNKVLLCRDMMSLVAVSIIHIHTAASCFCDLV